MRSRLLNAILSISIVGLASPAIAAEDPPEVSDSGMRLVEKDSRGAIYADPGVDWSVYSKIMLDDATVAFRKNWQRDQNRNRVSRVSTSDMEKIKSRLAELFDEVFVEELAGNGGYEIVDAAGENVLRITPHIMDLDIHAPDVSSSVNSRSYSQQAGRMTLKLELYDSETGDLIAVASDRRESRHHSQMQWSNRVNNRKDAEVMLKNWAEGLRKRLDEATGK